MKYTIPLFLAFLLLFPASGTAETKTQAPPSPVIGLVMHGSPKYGPNAKHLEYANPKAPKGGTLKSAAIGSFDSLNPFSIKGRAAIGLDLVYDRLMTRVWDEPFALYPLIAERVIVPADRSSITFILNPKARFHDSSPITADDVVFSFETLKKEGRPNMRSVYKLVESVQKPDERTVHFKLGAGYNRETVMILAMMPVLSKAYWSSKTFDAATIKPPLGSGPYKISEFEPGRRIIYERVKDYWAADLMTSRGHFNFDKIVYDYYRDDTIAFEAFKSGDLNWRRELDAGQWASAYDFPAIKNGQIKKASLPHGRPERTRGLIYNTRREPFNDIRVRQALSHVLNFEWANTNLYHGQYERIASYFPNSELAAKGFPSADEVKILEPFRTQIPAEVFQELPSQPKNTSAQERRENFRKADALLKESGWMVVDGRRMKNGKPLRFEILLDTPKEEKLVLNFKKSLERLGITTIIRALDSSAFRKRMNEYDFDMTLHFWQSSLSPGTEQILYWGCKAAKEPARWNFPGICNPAIDAIAANVANVSSRADLVNHMRALDRLLLAGHYMIPLYYTSADTIAFDAKIHNPDKTPLYGMVLETWWMDQPRPQN